MKYTISKQYITFVYEVNNLHIKFSISRKNVLDKLEKAINFIDVDFSDQPLIYTTNGDLIIEAYKAIITLKYSDYDWVFKNLCRELKQLNN